MTSLICFILDSEPLILLEKSGRILGIEYCMSQARQQNIDKIHENCYYLISRFSEVLTKALGEVWITLEV